MPTALQPTGASICMPLLPTTSGDRPSYGDFRFRAEIDFIKLELVTTVPTNYTAMRKLLGADFADPLDEGPGKAATRFLITFQDVKSWADLAARIDRLRIHPGLACEPTVDSIEVAVDAYHVTNDVRALKEMVTHMIRMAAGLTSENARAKSKEGKSDFRLVTKRQLDQSMADGKTTYVGHKSEKQQFRFYLKQTDRKKQLPESEWRARMEVTLWGDKLPFHSLDEWEKFRFVEFTRYFKFRKIRGDIDLNRLRIVEHLAMPGMVGKRRPVSRPKRSKSMRADSELNGRMYDALRGLTKRLRRPAKRSRRVGSPTAISVTK